MGQKARSLHWHRDTASTFQAVPGHDRLEFGGSTPVPIKAACGVSITSSNSRIQDTTGRLDTVYQLITNLLNWYRSSVTSA
jgi:hypothetical protein